MNRPAVQLGGRGRRVILAVLVVIGIEIAMSLLVFGWELVGGREEPSAWDSEEWLSLLGIMWIVPSVAVLLATRRLYRTASAEVRAMRVELEQRRAREKTWARSLGRQRRVIQAVVADGRVATHFQPIVRMGSAPELVGFEALSRFPEGTPDEWFRAAAETGLTLHLETAAIVAAIRHLDDLPDAAYLSLNVSPASLADGELLALFDALPADRVVIELTEHLVVQDYDTVNDALRLLRNRGMRVAVDDAGAGFASFRHVVNLAPDFIKLDRSLTRNVDTDRARHALASAITTFSIEVGATMVAEGVETPEEMTALLDIGVDYGQGWLFGRPAPAPSWKSLPGRVAPLPPVADAVNGS